MTSQAPTRCAICNVSSAFEHDHKLDLSGLDDGPPIVRMYRKTAAQKPLAEIAQIRIQAWQTRRARYGQHGHR